METNLVSIAENAENAQRQAVSQPLSPQSLVSVYCSLVFRAIVLSSGINVLAMISDPFAVG
jgi:hypothetical protein